MAIIVISIIIFDIFLTRAQRSNGIALIYNLYEKMRHLGTTPNVSFFCFLVVCFRT